MTSSAHAAKPPALCRGSVGWLLRELSVVTSRCSNQPNHPRPKAGGFAERATIALQPAEKSPAQGRGLCRRIARVARNARNARIARNARNARNALARCVHAARNAMAKEIAVQQEGAGYHLGAGEKACRNACALANRVT